MEYMDDEERELFQTASLEGVKAGGANITNIRSAWDAAFDRSQGTATQARYNAEQPIRDRNDYIDQLVADGVYTDAEIRQHVVVNDEFDYSGIADYRPKTNYTALAWLAKEKGVDMLDDDELDVLIGQQLTEAYATQEDVLERTAGVSATAGKLAGYVAGALWDPMTIPLMAIPGLGFAGGKAVGTAAMIGKVTAYEAALSAATEVATNEFATKPFQEKYGIESVSNLNAAIGGAVGGAVGGLLVTGPITAWATKAARKRAAQDAVGEVVEDVTPAAKAREEVSTVRDTPDTVRLQDIHRMDPTTDDYVATVSRAYDELPDGIRNIELDDAGTTPSRMVQDADDELARLEGFQACLLGAN